MASPQTTASAQKIANYTQPIPSGIANLLTELGRLNGAGCSDTAAILGQLQTLNTLVQAMGTRLTAVEKSFWTLHSGEHPDLIEIEPPEDMFLSNLTPKYALSSFARPTLTRISEHNARACRYNHELQYGNDVLMPLRTAHNTMVVGFPTTLGHLVSLSCLVLQTRAARLLKIYPEYHVESLLKQSFDLAWSDTPRGSLSASTHRNGS